MTTLKTIVLPEEIWTARAKIHHALVGPMCDAFISRRAIGLTHPVHDFLFTYYNCSPQKLKQWIPSLDERLETAKTLLRNIPISVDIGFVHMQIVYVSIKTESWKKLVNKPPL